MISSIQKILNKIKRFFLSNKISRVAIMSVAAMLAVGCLVAAACPITITDGTTVTTVNGYRNNSSALLAEAGVELGEHDTVETDSDGNLVVVRRFPITLVDGTESKTVYVANGTVGQMFAEENISLGEYDELSCDLNTSLVRGMTVSVSRISYRETKSTVAAAPGTRSVYSSSLWSGTKSVSPGKEGKKLVKSRIKSVNGKDVESTVLAETITEPPVDTVITIGTKTNGNWISHLKPSSPITLDANGVPTDYSRLVTGVASAYSPVDGRASATGVCLEAGYVAVNPNIIPYGSKLYITTADGSVVYGYAIAADTGAFTYLYPNRVVDLFFESEAQAEQFGLRNIRIYVLN